MNIPATPTPGNSNDPSFQTPQNTGQTPSVAVTSQANIHVSTSSLKQDMVMSLDLDQVVKLEQFMVNYRNHHSGTNIPVTLRYQYLNEVVIEGCESLFCTGGIDNPYDHRT